MYEILLVYMSMFSHMYIHMYMCIYVYMYILLWYIFIYVPKIVSSNTCKPTRRRLYAVERMYSI